MYVCMDGWMDGWMDGCMDGWMDGCMDGWMDGCMDGWMDGWKARIIIGRFNLTFLKEVYYD
jgi:hypothetical protein